MKSKSKSMQLKMIGIPVIENLEDFSNCTHLSKGLLYKLSRFSNMYYKTYEIPKANGKKRLISQPARPLKAIQAWILVNILGLLKVSPSCKGFEKGTSIVENANPHVGANAILVIDIDNFFPSIGANKVYNIFHSIGYNSLISTVFTNICTYSGTLPQGSPCSPKLANLTCLNLDARIQGLVGKKHIVYTRYADDMTFSSFSPNKLAKIFPMIETIINEEGFKLNLSKTRFIGTSKAKKVTGLIVNDDEVGIGKKQYRILRSKIHHLALSENINNFKLLIHVKGWLAFLKSVDYKRYMKTIKYIDGIKLKYPKMLIEKL